MFQPNVNGAAGDLHTTARLNNGILAGFPANFWRMNPAVGTGAAVDDDERRQSVGRDQQRQ